MEIQTYDLEVPKSNLSRWDVESSVEFIYLEVFYLISPFMDAWKKKIVGFSLSFFLFLFKGG